MKSKRPGVIARTKAFCRDLMSFISERNERPIEREEITIPIFNSVHFDVKEIAAEYKITYPESRHKDIDYVQHLRENRKEIATDKILNTAKDYIINNGVTENGTEEKTSLSLFIGVRKANY